MRADHQQPAAAKGQGAQPHRRRVLRGAYNGEESEAVVPPVLLLQEDSNPHVDEPETRSTERTTGKRPLRAYSPPLTLLRKALTATDGPRRKRDAHAATAIAKLCTHTKISESFASMEKKLDAAASAGGVRCGAV